MKRWSHINTLVICHKDKKILFFVHFVGQIVHTPFRNIHIEFLF